MMNRLPKGLAVLGEYRQFIAYELRHNKEQDNKLVKIPCNYKTGKQINANDSQNWTNFNIAAKSAQQLGGSYGIGFVLTKDDPLFCLDIDECLINGALDPHYFEIVDKLGGCFIEISKSGKGLHVWGSYDFISPHRSVSVKKINNKPVELYTDKRFIALTGDVWLNHKGSAAYDATQPINGLISEYFTPSVVHNEAQDWTDEPHPDWDGHDDDEELIAAALRSRSAKNIFAGKLNFSELWTCNVDAIAREFPPIKSTEDYDASRADAALAQHLAFWCGNDCERMLRLMHMSGLKREKWEREDYLQRTILNAVNRQTQFHSKKGISKAEEETHQTQLPKPEPLPELPGVLPFNYDYLPSILRDYISDISERMQCPPDFAVVAAYGMLASVCGRKVGIRPKVHDDWTVTPNLWGVIIGNSGVMKSPTLSEVLAPIKKLAAQAYERFNQKIAAYNETVLLANLQDSVNKSKAKRALKNNSLDTAKTCLEMGAIEDKPILKRYITNNSSYEALGEILRENTNGVLIEADELIGLLKQLDASGQEVARSFYLTSADGDKGYTFDRIMRGKGLHIEAVCLSIIGGIQPGVLAEYVKHANVGGAGADGLLQRFGLMVYPDISSEWKNIDRAPNRQAKQAVSELVAWLDDLDPVSVGAENSSYEGIPFLRFDKEAQDLFNTWREKLELKLRSGEEHPALVSHFSKYRKLIPSVALLNHLCESKGGSITKLALKRAIAFSKYLESHARRVYSFAVRPDMEAARTVLNNLVKGKLNSPFTARDLYRKGWAGLSTPNQAKAAIEILVEYGHLIIEKQVSEGRPTERYMWNKI